MNKPLTHTRNPAVPFADYKANQALRFSAHDEQQAFKQGARVGISRPHESAWAYMNGTAAYTDDVPERQGTLHCALGLAPVAKGKLLSIDLDTVKRMPGVVRVLTGADIPAENDCGTVGNDEPVLCDKQIGFLGQPIFAVVAKTRRQALRAAALAPKVLKIDSEDPILTKREAHAKGQYMVPTQRLVRSTHGDQRAEVESAIAAAPHRLQGQFAVGGQEQFYLEGQISYALPTEAGGMHVYCSTQHPSEMQILVAQVLGIKQHAVQVEVRRLGGGFGGKEQQSAQFACIAAVAASLLKRPVKLRMDRDDDIMVTGRRHSFWYEYDVGYDDDGKVLAVALTLVSNAGHSADLSAPVMGRAITHFDNAYWLPEVTMDGYSVKTNTQSNTAFRGFGGPQGAICIEDILDTIARRLGKDTLDVRKLNFYGKTERNVTPYGQTVDDNVIHELVDQLEASSDYRARRDAVRAFNAKSPVLKRGLALTPVKFGISFNTKYHNQAGALIHIYLDGSVLVNHGGIEMGQGVNSKVFNVVANELGIDYDRIRMTATDTSKVANTSATAASTGADLNGKAAQDAAHQLRERLAAYVAEKYGDKVENVRFANDKVFVAGKELGFSEVANAAYYDRVQLWSDGFYKTPGLSWDQATMKGHPFYYYAYGAAVSEVVVDTLTGEWKLLRADCLHDVGDSLNPATDIGQIEGGFIQGMGWLTTEELVWHPKTGKLMTHGPSTYKIPTANDCPPVFNVQLYKNSNAKETVYHSKAVGEPPLLLPFSVFFAIRDAVSAVADYRVAPPLRAPATSERILKAIAAVKAAERTPNASEPHHDRPAQHPASAKELIVS
jgi:xanthine dehydrogenase large subunit